MLENQFARPVLVVWNGRMIIVHFRESDGRWWQMLLEIVSDSFQPWRPRLTRSPSEMLRKKIRCGEGREAIGGFCLEYMELEVLHWQSRSRSGILLLCQQSLSGLGKWWKFSGSSSRNLEREAVVSVGEDWMFEALIMPALNGFRLLMDWKSRSYEAKWENKATRGKTGKEQFVLRRICISV